MWNEECVPTLRLVGTAGPTTFDLAFIGALLVPQELIFHPFQNIYAPETKINIISSIKMTNCILYNRFVQKVSGALPMSQYMLLGRVFSRATNI